jgi:hypothetical protein
MLVGSGATLAGDVAAAGAGATKVGTAEAGTFEAGEVEVEEVEVKGVEFEGAEVEGLETGFDFGVETFFAGAVLSLLSAFFEDGTSLAAAPGWLAALLDGLEDVGVGPATGTVGVVLTGASLVAV